jgi:hypothetical protein
MKSHDDNLSHSTDFLGVGAALKSADAEALLGLEFRRPATPPHQRCEEHVWHDSRSMISVDIRHSSHRGEAHRTKNRQAQPSRDMLAKHVVMQRLRRLAGSKIKKPTCRSWTATRRLTVGSELSRPSASITLTMLIAD